MNSKKINPKRRKANDNPYTIFFRVETNEYLLTFNDGQGVKHEMLIDKALYNEFGGFELDDKKRLNESERHDERSELSDADYMIGLSPSRIMLTRLCLSGCKKRLCMTQLPNCRRNSSDG